MRTQNDHILQCRVCYSAIPFTVVNTEEMTSCLQCGTRSQIAVFPSFLRPPELKAPGVALEVEDQASCYYHPEKKAERECDFCGRFLCSLCDIDFGNNHYCPTCLESKDEKRKRISELENRHVLYDSLALSVAVLPMLIFYLTIFTAPVALWLAIRHWKTPLSLFPRNRWRFVLAILISIGQLAGWGLLLFFLIRGVRNAS